MVTTEGGQRGGQARVPGMARAPRCWTGTRLGAEGGGEESELLPGGERSWCEARLSACPRLKVRSGYLSF